VSVAEPFTFPSEAGRFVHGLFYAPTRASRSAPPLVVVCHGGPTGSAEAGFDPFVQLLAQRGIAVAAVDFAGSTGYGRAFRRSLEGGWGVTDVRDCLAAARQLAEGGRVDGRSMAIRGKSAGGLTALGALAEDQLFRGAVSWYGVTDLLHLAEVTHDFERHYSDRLIGPLPEAADEYRRRSPVHRVAEMHGAVLLFQGLDDPVVPPSQARAMAEALTRRGVPCRLLTFENEGHGFRRAETLTACLEAEMAFYQELFARPGP
jgi:dipeptidyl aminopeptidase/acylaminoacyl peptidase